MRTGHAFRGPAGCRRAPVVVDNGSDADARGRVAAGLPTAEVVRVGRNAGFGGAANVGLRRWLDRGGGEWVVVAPHDALPEPDCLRRLLDAVAEARPRAGLASADVRRAGQAGGRPLLRRDPRRPPTHEGWEDAGHPHGTLLLARRACLEDIGLFDERYFAYCEEADLGLRARRPAGRSAWSWGAVVRNPSVSVGSEVAEYLMLRNSLLLVREHFGRYPAFIRICFALVNTTRLGLHPAARGPFFSWPARRRALVRLPARPLRPAAARARGSAGAAAVKESPPAIR